ncbi:hypothetical protein ABL78_0827 [Leptomonas seymouri]|uniref:Leucine-rich repeat protein (LRRP) n=1 Tax=Leptomonas seymouri TaxID=5684 RepID=A0A0N1I334_LEPSE|nr:hypothetical protein ABL78_0827 [Leptomonas seymouri]|eukprot:KPI90074.1 hypothetical protein ABL78_0827 [Leptomonas seymouri]
MQAFSSSSALQRGGGVPPPSRPRLLARTSADGKSPSPPARLAPIAPLVTTAASPDPAPPELEGVSQRLTSANHDGRASGVLPADHYRHQLNEEGEENEEQVRQQQMSLRSETLCSTSSVSSPPSSLLFSTPLSRGGAGNANKPVCSRNVLRSVRSSHRSEAANSTIGANSTPSAARAETVLHSKVMLTPPRSGSGYNNGVAWEGSAEVTCANTAEWTGQGRVEQMMTAKRERFVGSADTQHSIASSSNPPPRSKRAFDDNCSKNRTQSETAERCSVVLAEEGGIGSTAKRFEQRERRRLNNSTSRRSCSSGAISNSSSSDFVTTAAQCLVIDDSVDNTAIMSPHQLQRLLSQASGMHSDGGVEEPPSPYRRRLIIDEVLRDWTGWEDLELVLSTQLRVDAEAMIGVDQIGQLLPSLSSLKLNGSRIPRLRQLGTGFHALKYLWLNSCHLTDLRGLAACCPGLVELYVSFNHIKDATPVMELSSTLEVLDVEGNLLDDAIGLGFVLSALQKVSSLSIQGNPLTCEHRGRVREAYAAIKADEDNRQDEEKAYATATPATGTDKERFTDVLRAWVRCLMPNLQTLNDEPMQRRDEGTALAAALKLPTPCGRAVHVDPLDNHLAEELQLVAECVRAMDPFDPLLEAVEEANQRFYTRPSTSCNGARPRLTPATAMGASRASTSAWSCSAAASRRLGSGAAMDASVLTTGAVLAGSATSSLRRRAATPTPTSLTSSLDGVPAGASRDYHDGAYSSAEATANATSTRLGGQAHRSRGGLQMEILDDEDARVAALLADDSEEDEWETYKSSLLLSSTANLNSSNAGVVGAADSSLMRHPSLISLSSAAQVGDPEASVHVMSAGAALPTEEDGFHKELMNEWSRLRLRMAKTGRTL